MIKWITNLFKSDKTALNKPDVKRSFLTASCGCKIKEGKILDLCGEMKAKRITMEMCYQSGMQMLGGIQEGVIVDHCKSAIEQTKNFA